MEGFLKQTMEDKSRELADSIGLGGLLLDKIMPPLHWLCLMTGQKYDCGADYKENHLKRSIEDLESEYQESHLSVEDELIKCDCNDPQCNHKVGLEGEVANHIEECGCGDCHRHYSKL